MLSKTDGCCLETCGAHTAASPSLRRSSGKKDSGDDHTSVKYATAIRLTSHPIWFICTRGCPQSFKQSQHLLYAALILSCLITRWRLVGKCSDRLKICMSGTCRYRQQTLSKVLGGVLRPSRSTQKPLGLYQIPSSCCFSCLNPDWMSFEVIMIGSVVLLHI